MTGITEARFLVIKSRLLISSIDLKIMISMTKSDSQNGSVDLKTISTANKNHDSRAVNLQTICFNFRVSLFDSVMAKTKKDTL